MGAESSIRIPNRFPKKKKCVNVKSEEGPTGEVVWGDVSDASKRPRASGDAA